MSKYTEFDAVLIRQIKAGHNTMSKLDSMRSGMHLRAQAFRRGPDGVFCETFRVIDRRLQSLRKAGKISFAGGVWVAL